MKWKKVAAIVLAVSMVGALPVAAAVGEGNDVANGEENAAPFSVVAVQTPGNGQRRTSSQEIPLEMQAREQEEIRKAQEEAQKKAEEERKVQEEAQKKAEEEAKKQASYVTKLQGPTTIETPPVIKSAKAQKKGKVSLSWKKLGKKKSKKIKRIEIMYSTDPDFINDVHVRKMGKKKTSATLRNLKKNQVYYIMMHYIGSDGTSEWSDVQTVQTRVK